MTHGTFSQFFIFGFMTCFTTCMGCFFESGELFRHSCCFVMAGLTFFNFLTFNIINFFSVSIFGMMAIATLYGLLMPGVVKNGRFCFFSFVKMVDSRTISVGPGSSPAKLAPVNRARELRWLRRRTM